MARSTYPCPSRPAPSSDAGSPVLSCRMDPAGLRPLGVGEILDVAIKIYRSRFGVLIKSVAVVLAPVFVLTAAIGLSLPANEDVFGATQPGETPKLDAGDLWTFLAGVEDRKSTRLNSSHTV